MTNQLANRLTGGLLVLGFLLQLGVYRSMSMFVPAAAVAVVWIWIQVWIAHLPEDTSSPSVRRHLQWVQVIFATAIAVMPLQPLLARNGVPMPESPVLGLAAIGILVVLLGNRMNKLRKNAAVGIRNTWTLADDEVWLGTHRLLGRVMVAVGIVHIAIVLMGPLSWVHGSIALFVVGIIFVRLYSLWLYRRLHPVAD